LFIFINELLLALNPTTQRNSFRAPSSADPNKNPNKLLVLSNLSETQPQSESSSRHTADINMQISPGDMIRTAMMKRSSYTASPVQKAIKSKVAADAFAKNLQTFKVPRRRPRPPHNYNNYNNNNNNNNNNKI